MPIVITDLLYKHSKSTASADGESGHSGLGGYMSADAVESGVSENMFAKVTGAEAATGSTKYRAMFIKNNHGSLSLQSAKVFMTSNSPETHLHEALVESGSEDHVHVHDNSTFPSQGSFFCESEEIAYTGKSGSSPNCQFTGCTRGSNGTTRAAHDIGAPVEHNQLRLDVEAPGSQPGGAIQTIANEDAPPSGLSWQRPISYDTGVSIGNLAAGNKYGIWLRRKVPLGSWAEADIYVTIDVQGETDA